MNAWRMCSFSAAAAGLENEDRLKSVRFLESIGRMIAIHGYMRIRVLGNGHTVTFHASQEFLIFKLIFLLTAAVNT